MLLERIGSGFEVHELDEAVLAGGLRPPAAPSREEEIEDGEPTPALAR